MGVLRAVLNWLGRLSPYHPLLQMMERPDLSAAADERARKWRDLDAANRTRRCLDVEIAVIRQKDRVSE